MFATDFMFDGQRASDFGCMVCSFDGGLQPVSGGEVEYNTIKTPGRDAFTFYSSQFNSPATWSFSICKNPYGCKDMHFSQYEESMIMKWLVKTDGYRWMQFEQEGFEDIFYRVMINVLPHQVAGRTIGFDLTATSNCAYGFTDVITKKTSFLKYGTLKFDIHSDINSYILPITKINTNTSNKINYFSISNYVETSLGNPALHMSSTFRNISGNISMDSESDIIDGLSSPDEFNWSFLRLMDGKNTIMIATDFYLKVDIEIQYREPRYVRV